MAKMKETARSGGEDTQALEAKLNPPLRAVSIWEPPQSPSRKLHNFHIKTVDSYRGVAHLHGVPCAAACVGGTARQIGSYIGSVAPRAGVPSFRRLLLLYKEWTSSNLV